MSEFFATLWSEIQDLLSFFVTVALLQNVILITGFGSSVMLHMVRKPKNIWLFSGLLAVFSTLTVVIAYPLDRFFGTEMTNLWRPFMMVGITAVLYVVFTLLLKWLAPNFYTRVSRMLHMAAFNNLVTGIALICNAHFAVGLAGNIGLAIGSSLSFGILTWLTAEGIERMDNPDMPEAFRGMPSTLLYVGLLGLALMGFTSTFNLI
jgi:Na+-translocating ferredoxin:NAD+ oxidoreductase RnfA subunit